MWCVDTCVLIDIAEADEAFAEASALCLKAKLEEGLCLCPVSFVELGPLFGRTKTLESFLAGVGVECEGMFDPSDRDLAFSAWSAHVARRRAGNAVKRPIADILIGAYAHNRGGLITRNPGDFRPLYPKLSLLDPRPLSKTITEPR